MTAAAACYIFGAGAHGRVVADILLGQNHPLAGFLDDDPGLHGKVVAGFPVIGGSDLLLDGGFEPGLEIVIALGNPALRLRWFERCRERGYVLINAVHPSASVSPSAVLGQGICICARAVVNPDAAIGDAVILNTGATVDHDCRVADGSQLSPGVNLSGRVQVGRLSFLGTGVSVAPRVRIGAHTVVGAGAAVVWDLPDGVLAVGVPARVARELNEPIDWSRLL